MFCLQTGTTALFFAAQGGFLDIVRILLANNAPVDSASVVRYHIVDRSALIHNGDTVFAERVLCVAGRRQPVICRVPVWTYGRRQRAGAGRGGR